MKKTDRKAAAAFIAGTPCTVSINTRVEKRDGAVVLTLFGNVIAAHDIDTGEIFVRHCVHSYTTRMRLNAVAQLLGTNFHAYQSKHRPCVDYCGETFEDVAESRVFRLRHEGKRSGVR